VLLALTLFNAVLGLNQEGKAAAAVAALQKMMIVKAKVRRGGELIQVPAELGASEFAEGSMGPKVRAACMFAERTGGIAAIGSIADTQALLRGEAGTTVALETASIS
ncbi:MAG TPA: hypothetical protein VE757_01705, partial [Gaiellaceae bacterium]|nr:hypothetical protein [Gaiellaceae bacterium]